MKEELNDISLSIEEKKIIRQNYIEHIKNIKQLYSEIKENIDGVKEYYLEEEPDIILDNLDFIEEDKKKPVKKKPVKKKPVKKNPKKPVKKKPVKNPKKPDDNKELEDDKPVDKPDDDKESVKELTLNDFKKGMNVSFKYKGEENIGVVKDIIDTKVIVIVEDKKLKIKLPVKKLTILD